MPQMQAPEARNNSSPAPQRLGNASDAWSQKSLRTAWLREHRRDVSTMPSSRFAELLLRST